MSFESPAAKYHYVNQMFGRIAHRYDLMNRLMTAGQDKRWRKWLVQQADLPGDGKLLDIATGTGDIAFEAVVQQPNLKHVVGADFSLPMMQVGQKRLQQMESVSPVFSWSGADTLHLPFPDNTFDSVVSGFLMRNVVDVEIALSEQTRVCKKGGRVLILEIPRPADHLGGQLFRLYFHYVVPFLGGIISGQGDAYHYLPASADAFLRPDELKAKMEAVGLHQVEYTMFMFNTIAIHIGVK